MHITDEELLCHLARSWLVGRRLSLHLWAFLLKIINTTGICVAQKHKNQHDDSGTRTRNLLFIDLLNKSVERKALQNGERKCPKTQEMGLHFWRGTLHSGAFRRPYSLLCSPKAFIVTSLDCPRLTSFPFKDSALYFA